MGYYFNLLGFKNIRAASAPESEWHKIEKKKGVFDFSIVDEQAEYVKKSKPTWVYMVAYNN